MANLFIEEKNMLLRDTNNCNCSYNNYKLSHKLFVIILHWHLYVFYVRAYRESQEVIPQQISRRIAADCELPNSKVRLRFLRFTLLPPCVYRAIPKSRLSAYTPGRWNSTDSDRSEADVFWKHLSACNLGAAAFTQTDFPDFGPLSFAARTRACGRGIEEGTPSRPKLDHLAGSAGIRSTSPKSARLESVDFPRYCENHGSILVDYSDPIILLIVNSRKWNFQEHIVRDKLEHKLRGEREREFRRIWRHERFNRVWPGIFLLSWQL